MVLSYYRMPGHCRALSKGIRRSYTSTDVRNYRKKRRYSVDHLRNIESDWGNTW